MRFAPNPISIRTLFFTISGTLAIAGCAMDGQGAPPSDDPQADETDTTPQEPYAAVCNGGRFICKSHVRTDTHNRIKPFATPSGLGPADLTSAYKLSASVTSTATIAIVDAFNYANAESDLAQYRSTFGLSACTRANGCLTIINQSGAASPLPAAPPAGDDWTVEAALDLDMASAACPTCKLLLVEAQDDQGDGLFIAQNTAAAFPGVVAISNSWGESSPGDDATLDTQFFTHTQAVNVFVSSGDSGNTGAAGDYPSTSEHVIAVGGTRLARSTTAARGWTETAWTGAGSTCSSVLAQPAFQSGVVPAAACRQGRAASDVSAVADPNSGVAVFNRGAGGFIVVGGTSASSPYVAGVFARYGITATAGRDASFAYSNKAEFFDITSGRNGNCTSALGRAAAGWDGPTGIGSPNGALLAP